MAHHGQSSSRARRAPVLLAVLVLASLPAQYRSSHNGYTGTIHKSAWANWTTRHPAPWKVGVSFSQISPLDVTQQLQQFNSPVQPGVDLIIYEPFAPASFAPAVDEAAKARLAGWAR